MADYLQVSTTAPDRDAAVALIKGAVEARLAASGQVAGPLTAAFIHLGEFGTGEEWQVLLRTTRARYPELEVHLVDAHPWDNPEVTFTAIDGGSAAYLEWLTRETAPPA